MKLIVGLGNPGAKYRDTLHNVGFKALDSLADSLRESQWSQKFKGEFIRGRMGNDAFVVLKPMTYMNISGESVLACLQFFKLELEDMLVVSDDIDRPLGSLRYRKSGGHGGHNGLRSIIQLCGGSNFHRIKIGIGRPEGPMDVSNYVLSKLTSEMNRKITPAIEQVIDYLTLFIRGKTIQIIPEVQKAVSPETQ
jgi:PTH1 family peptidyl-tRNA hydrolase